MEPTELPLAAGAYARFGKPILDRVFGLVLALLTLPVVVFLLIRSWIAFGWPPLARVSRTGRNDRRFNLYRINTRKDFQTDLRGQHLRLSSLLRSTSLDELPQLWNVVLGHMSLVGPRPLDPVTALKLEKDAARRHGARPGLTGPWQLEARGDGRRLTDHISVDLAYVENISFFGDLALLFRTLPVLLREREEV